MEIRVPLKKHHERKSSARKELSPPEIGLLLTDGTGHALESGSMRQTGRLFVDLLDRSPDGIAIKTGIKLDRNTLCRIQMFNKAEKCWEIYEAKVKWTESQSTPNGNYKIGVQLNSELKNDPSLEDKEASTKSKPTGGDYLFFRRTKLLKSIPREAVCPLLNSITLLRISAGERFITQGSPGDRCYVIQRGTCVVSVEKNGELTPVARLREGDIVGEMAILTGESRSAHVDAESDMKLWELTKEQFDRIAGEFPELRTFLTELLANWFETRTITANRRIGKYLLTDIIGTGGYSFVYRGLHEALNKPVAIKMMKHDMAMESDFIKKFREEARTIANFNHQNIVHVYDIEERFRTVFIIMEYLKGMSLRKLLQNMIRLPSEQVVDYLLQICTGLQYAHDRDIVHQDIKPGNIYILPNNRVKILDFGLSCPCGSENFLSGTPYYMSPEQIECLPVDQRADIFALGLLAYEMLTGQRPFKEADAWTVMDLHTNQEIPDPSEILPELPDQLRRLIIKACKREPDQRYQSMLEVIEALNPMAEKLGILHRASSKQDRKIATMVLIYEDSDKAALNKEMAEFCSRMTAIGIDCKTAEFNDI
jgi:CRP-like cAMP-binding protein/tRNA A-37 threonylcarbamoyl transferase component Bud32